MDSNNSSAESTMDLSGVDFSINGNWGDGYQGQIDITNQGQESIDGWTLEFKYDGNLSNIWNAEIISQEGNTYVIGNSDHNGVVEPNQEVAVGFIGEGSAADEPESFKFNGDNMDNPNPEPPPEPNEPTVEEPTVEEPTMEEPTVEEPTMEEPTMEEPTVEEPTMEEPTVEEPTVEEPTFDGGGGTFQLAQNSVAEGFDVATDKVNLGSQSIHDNIPVQTSEGLAFRFQWDGTDYLLEDVKLKDLSADNFEAIADNHLRQDVSAVMAWEKGTGPRRSNTVYVRGHQEGLQETVDFNPATDKVSFFYYNNRGENSVVEETAEGIKFTSNVTGQSLTLRGVQFSDLSSENFEFRGGQVEDRIDQRMGLAEKIDGGMRIVEGNVFSGEGIARAGIVDPSAGYLAGAYPAYTGGSGTSVSSPDTVVEDFNPEPIARTDDGHDHDHGDSEMEAQLVSMPDPATDLQEMTFGSDFAMQQGMGESMPDDVLAQQSVMGDVNTDVDADNLIPTEDF